MIDAAGIQKRIFQSDTVFLAKDRTHFTRISGCEHRVVHLNYNLNRYPRFYTSLMTLL